MRFSLNLVFALLLVLLSSSTPLTLTQEYEDDSYNLVEEENGGGRRPPLQVAKEEPCGQCVKEECVSPANCVAGSTPEASL